MINIEKSKIMKKIVYVFITLFLLMEVPSFAQETVYVIFTSRTDNVTPGVKRIKSKKKIFRYPTQYFGLWLEGVYVQTFEYKNYDDEPDNPVVEKPESFLAGLSNNVLYDWDIIMHQVKTKEEAEAYFEKFIGAEKLYFIDRQDIKDNKCYLVPVRKYGQRKYGVITFE